MTEKRCLSGRELIGVFIIAVLVTSCLKSGVNYLVERLMPFTELTVSRIDDSPERYVKILYEVYEENSDELFLDLKAANDQNANGWYFEQGVLNERWTMLQDTPECTSITIQTKVTPRKYIAFMANRAGGLVEVRSGNDTLIIDLYRDQDDSEIYRVYPFGHSKRVIVFKLLFYFVLFCVVVFILYVVVLLLGRKYRPLKAFQREIGISDYFFCFGVFWGVGIFLYKVVGIPNYLQVGDELGYWETLLFHNGRFDLDYLSGLFAPRGYWCYIPQTLAQSLGSLLSIDASILWILLLTVCWSLFVCGLFPKLYQSFTGKKALRVHVWALMLILLTTWRQLLTSVLMDSFGMMTFMAFVYFCNQIFEQEKWRGRALAAGIFASISCSFRTANLLGIAGFAVFEFICRKRGKYNYKQVIESLCIFWMAFVLICLPQLAINLNRGHLGFLPYDHDQAWLGRSVTLWSSDYAMAHGNVAYPLLATDDQMLSMKNQVYNNETPLTMEQLLDIYLNSPVEAMMLIGKKLLIGFDQKTNIAHPGDGAVPWRETSGILFSLWNYFLLYSGLYAFCKERDITKRERWFAALVFVLTVLPETFMKIEWRYLMSGYFTIYYFFAFHFVGPLATETDKRTELLSKTGYLWGLGVFMFTYLTMSFMFLA